MNEFVYFQAHLENALRLELDERNLKIEALNTKIKLLQSYSTGVTDSNATESKYIIQKYVEISCENLTDNKQNLFQVCPK